VLLAKAGLNDILLKIVGLHEEHKKDKKKNHVE